MRIAVNGRFLAARTTGVQRVAREVVAALTRTADVTVLTPRGVAHTGAGTAASGWTRGVVWEQLELPLRRGLGDYDVALDPANAGPLLGGRRILVLSDAFPLTHPEWYGPAFRRWFRLVVAPAARRAERVIMFSRWAREQAITAMGLDADRVVIATQGTAPFHEPAPRPRVDTVRARLGLSSPYLLATGVGDARKNVPFLRQVLDRLRDEYRANPALALTGAPYPYVHAGTPPLVGADFRLLGHVSDVELHALYTGAAAFCFPSLAEGFGRPPLEAMACGTPVVAADYGCAREVLGDAASVLPLDAGAWADRLARLLDDGDARREAGEAGRAHAAGFQWDAAAGVVLDACRAVARSRARPAGAPRPDDGRPRRSSSPSGGGR